jgi:hypothetical protein
MNSNHTKIYFCGSITGGRQLESIYGTIIRLMKKYGEVLTEHVGDPGEASPMDQNLSDKEIHDRDVQWISESNLVVAEVTVPSLGVGYEIARSLEMDKPVLCLFDSSYGKRLSAMIAGRDGVSVFEYSHTDQLDEVIGQFITAHAPHHTS